MNRTTSKSAHFMGLPLIKAATFAILPFLIGSCAQRPSIGPRDANEVLILTAARANIKFGSGYCINPKMSTDKMEWAGELGKDGWITAAKDKNLRYHPMPEMNVMALPSDALSSFTKAKIGTNCRHVIVFNKPQFIEMKTPTESFVEAEVNFSDLCGLCGFGAIARFRKVDGVWKMTPPGIEGTWVS